MYQHLLVPVGETDASIQAVGHATGFAQAIGARITFLYVSPVYSDDIGAPRWNADRRAGGWLARAEAGARAQGVPCTSVVAEDGSLDAIITEALRHGCDLVYTNASRAREEETAGSGRSGGALRPAVLYCEADERPAVSGSIGALLHEHRTLVHIVHGCLSKILTARQPGAVTSTETVREMVRTLYRLPARGIHAKEKAALIRRLCKRTSRVNPELAELERLHQRDDELLHELARMIGRESEDEPTVESLEESLSAYARNVDEWMGREQGVILPAARRYFSYADWAEIHCQFNSADLVRETAEIDITYGEPGGPRA